MGISAGNSVGPNENAHEALKGSSWACVSGFRASIPQYRSQMPTDGELIDDGHCGLVWLEGETRQACQRTRKLKIFGTCVRIIARKTRQACQNSRRIENLGTPVWCGKCLHVPEVAGVKTEAVQSTAHDGERQSDHGRWVAFDGIDEPTTKCFEGERACAL